MQWSIEAPGWAVEEDTPFSVVTGGSNSLEQTGHILAEIKYILPGENARESLATLSLTCDLIPMLEFRRRKLGIGHPDD